MTNLFSIFKTYPIVWTLFLTLSVTGAVAGCSSSAEKEQANISDSIKNSRKVGEDELYNLAQEAIRTGNYLSAALHLEQINTLFPLGRFYDQAQLDLIYVRYLLNEKEVVEELTVKFLELNPNHANSDYAVLIRALNKYIGDKLASAQLFNLEQGTRNVAEIRESFLELKNFIKQFPESPFTSIARTRMLVLKEMMARHEVEVAMYYFERNNWVATINRTVYLLHNLRDTQYSEWALALLSASYTQVGKPNDAQIAYSQLIKNFPASPLIDKKNNAIVKNMQLPSAERTFTNILSLGMFIPPQPTQLSIFKQN